MDERLIAELYEKYRKEILLYVYSLCHSREVAEDITQEVFMKAILSLNEEHGNFRAWLYTVARNLTYNHTRKNQNKAKVIEELKHGTFVEDDIGETIVTNERYRELYEAISRLPENYREILIMQYFSNMQLKDVAAVLGLTPGNARILAHRAKNKLREMMEEKEP